MKFLIASFPRSGNHWVRYIIEYCTHLRTMGEGDAKHRKNKDQPVFDRIDHQFYKHGGFAGRKRHWIRRCDTHLDLILLIRSYKEVFIRHNPKVFVGNPRIKPALNKMIRDYVNLLRWYDKWPESNRKKLIYYEDLISDPDIVRSIMDFIGHRDRFHDFWKDADFHKRRCLSVCSHHTNGNKKVHYSRQVDPDWIKFLENYFKRNYPKLVENYLGDY